MNKYRIVEVPTTMISVSEEVVSEDLVVRNGLYMFYKDSCTNDLIAAYPTDKFWVELINVSEELKDN